MTRFFDVSVSSYSSSRSFSVYYPSSLNHPKSNSVMFITLEYMHMSSVFSDIKDCLVFWPTHVAVSEHIFQEHVIVKCDNPRLEFCKFFKTNGITNHPHKHHYNFVEGAYISSKAHLCDNVTVFPGVLIDPFVTIGENSIIGSGTKILGNVTIGNNVVIRENVVIGADGLTTDRDVDGRVVSMPQFGGVIIENDVEIGANTVIARGAIDNTIIKSGSKVDNCCFISHNVVIGEDTLIVGETILFGSATTGKQVYISGNATIRNGVHLGDFSVVGMGSVVTKNVDPHTTVIGNPAKSRG